MNFEFEIQNKVLRQKRSHHHHKGDIVSSFVFKSKEWNHLDKYVIFWNKKGKNTIRYITDGKYGECEIPKMCLDDLYFYIQIYANEEFYTQKLKVFNKTPCSEKNIHYQNGDAEFINKLLNKLDDKIDNIEYENNSLKIYSNNKLINTIELVDSQLIYKILSGQAPGYIVDTVLSPDSDNPLANKTIYNLINKKVEYAQLSHVAFSGEYSDLSGIPNEFTPEQHTHNVAEIIDFDINIDNVLDQLALEFYKGD